MNARHILAASAVLVLTGACLLLVRDAGRRHGSRSEGTGIEVLPGARVPARAPVEAAPPATAGKDGEHGNPASSVREAPVGPDPTDPEETQWREALAVAVVIGSFIKNNARDEEIARLIRCLLHGPRDGPEGLEDRLRDRSATLTCIAECRERLGRMRPDMATPLAEEVRVAYGGEADARAKAALLRILSSLPGDKDSAELALSAIAPGSDKSLRAAAIEVLGAHMETQGAVGAISSAARSDPVSSNRKEALQALGASSDPQARTTLLDVLLDDPDPSQRSNAADALAIHPCNGTYEALVLGYERNQDHSMRVECLASLGAEGSPRSWAFIERAAGDADDPYVRSFATELLQYHERKK